MKTISNAVFSRFSVLPALSLNDQILHCDIVEGAFDSNLFYQFVVRLIDQMQPWPAPNSVIVMDNCRIISIQLSWSWFVQGENLCCYMSLYLVLIIMLDSAHRGIRVEFLPPYSPDYNPIELTFSAMKYYLRRNGDYICLAMTELSNMDIYFALSQALYEITADGVSGWFRHCGYIWVAIWITYFMPSQAILSGIRLLKPWLTKLHLPSFQKSNMISTTADGYQIEDAASWAQTFEPRCIQSKAFQFRDDR